MAGAACEQSIGVDQFDVCEQLSLFGRR